MPWPVRTVINKKGFYCIMKQFKIGIIGTENSHAWAFTKFFNQPDENGNFAYPDCHVTLVYGHYPEESKKTVEQYGADAVAESIEQMVANVDAVMITARDGKYHAEFARPFVEAGIPAFVDKPFTVDPQEAIDLVRLAKQKGVPLCGGSSLKQDCFVKELRRDRETERGGKTLGGFVRAPYQAENAYGGFCFYAPHLVEMVCEIFGRFPRSVTATRNGEQIHVLFHYDAYDCVGLYCNRSYVYFASRMAETESTAREIPSTNEWFYWEFKEFYQLLQGAPQSVGYEEFIAPVFILNAVERSLESGREEVVRPIEIKGGTV